MHTYTPSLRNRYLLLSDIIGLVVSLLLAYTLRFDGWSWLSTEQREVAWIYCLIAVPVRLVLFYVLGLYRRFWSLASVEELELLVVSAVTAGVCSILIGAVALPLGGVAAGRVPISVVLIDALLAGVAIILPRLAARLLERQRALWQGRRTMSGRRSRPALIVGAGSSAQSVARELLAQPGAAYRPVGFIDDGIGGRRRGMLGDLPVLGRLEDLSSAARATGAMDIIIAMPSASGDVLRAILGQAREHGLTTTIAPSILNVGTRTPGPLLRNVRIEDLLRRDPVVVDMDRVHQRLRGRTIMITGAGGSIGAELCRQIAHAQPERLVLVGRGENSIFEIQQELASSFPQLPTEPVILDVRDRQRMAILMQAAAPYAVFHAAAHKHVPLMEANIYEAISNNAMGTLSVVDAARATGVRHVVLISTDKAVRPTSIMGATKRLAEQIVQRAAAESGLPYVSVRFGNVLGSRGSVIPTFLRQIAAGGPILVTHPDMRRYFMTIPEAVQLMLQAFLMGEGGEVFCLDMGEPVSILTLAKDLITLTVDDPAQQIAIRFSGIRPGEKLTEELFFSEETAERTQHPKILRARLAEIENSDVLRLGLLLDQVREGSTDEALRAFLSDLLAEWSQTGGGPADAPLRPDALPTVPIGVR
jgi:FlaA1/EpsC-like NDP-sugar epimerase